MGLSARTTRNREWAAYGEFVTSELGQAFRRDGIAVNGDGTFRIEGLPETQYLLYVTAYRKPARPVANAAR